MVTIGASLLSLLRSWDTLNLPYASAEVKYRHPLGQREHDESQDTKADPVMLEVFIHSTVIIAGREDCKKRGPSYTETVTPQSEQVRHLSMRYCSARLAVNLRHMQRCNLWFSHKAIIGF